MKRSEFISTIGVLTSAVIPLQLFSEPSGKIHIVSLSFDDGFRKSFIRTAKIYEKFGLSACFNVTAASHNPEVGIEDDYVDSGQLGDFTLWNELRERGHEVMPHGYRHAHLDRLPFEEAKELISDCLEIFEAELKGFEAKRAVFNFPYNDATPELEAWITSRVLAYRCHGEMINPLPHDGLVRIGTGGYGPGNAEAHLDEQIEDLLSRDSGWLVYNLHGLDEEGWGPIGSEYLERLLARLTKIDSVSVLPTARALIQAQSASFGNN
jgi:peptidoglycan/xylan/chitin deacetylase (PgdA/CDA1 family)